MGQRLNIEIILNGETQANAYYHWSGYTSSALGLTKVVLENAPKIKHEQPAIRAIRLLEATGALLNEDEIEQAKQLAPNENFDLASSRNDGLIAVTKKGIEETRSWEEARVEIDFDQDMVRFSVYWSDEKGVFLGEYEKEEEEYETLPLRDYAFDAVSFQDFNLFAEDLLGLIQEGIYNIRLKDGDVVSFIE